MSAMLAVRRFEAGDVHAATAIIRGLPDYFTDDVPAKLAHDAASHEAWVLADSEKIAGIAVAARKSPGGAEILWLAVDAARRGQGHGTRLLGHVLDHLAATGISVVEVKTLDRSAGYEPYEATRAFLGAQRLRLPRHDRPAAWLAARQPSGDIRRRAPPDTAGPPMTFPAPLSPPMYRGAELAA
jgi:GNAT superfamily N-acetyltransferase